MDSFIKKSFARLIFGIADNWTHKEAITKTDFTLFMNNLVDILGGFNEKVDWRLYHNYSDLDNDLYYNIFVCKSFSLSLFHSEFTSAPDPFQTYLTPYLVKLERVLLQVEKKYNETSDRSPYYPIESTFLHSVALIVHDMRTFLTNHRSSLDLRPFGVVDYSIDSPSESNDFVQSLKELESLSSKEFAKYRFNNFFFSDKRNDLMIDDMEKHCIKLSREQKIDFYKGFIFLEEYCYSKYYSTEQAPEVREKHKSLVRWATLCLNKLTSKTEHVNTPKVAFKDSPFSKQNAFDVFMFLNQNWNYKKKARWSYMFNFLKDNKVASNVKEAEYFKFINSFFEKTAPRLQMAEDQSRYETLESIYIEFNA